MWKKIIASIMIALTLISFSSFGYATKVIDKTKYEILNPEKLSYSTSDKVVLINGKAPSNSEIVINVYGTTDLTRRNFNLDKLPSGEDYILIASEKATSGNMGLFQKQMDLVRGINKLVIDFGVEGLDKVQIIVYVYNKVIITLREPSIKTILPLLR